MHGTMNVKLSTDACKYSLTLLNYYPCSVVYVLNKQVCKKGKYYFFVALCSFLLHKHPLTYTVY
jgi:hypothetical protein